MEKNKKKILIFLTRVPYPPVDGTRFKIFNNVIQGLKPDFDLEFCIVTDDKVVDSQIEYLENNFGKLHLFLYPRWRFYWNAIKFILSSLPMQAGYYYFREVNKWFIKNEKYYDGIYIHTLRLARYVEKAVAVVNNKILLDFNDAISLNYKEGKKFASLFWRLVYSLEEGKIRRYETRLLGEFKYFNVASGRDRNYLLNNYSKSGFNDGFVFENIKHGVDSNVFRYSWNKRKDSLVFMGNLKYPPNRDAVDNFLGKLWPDIRREMPQLKFIVIGRKDGLNFVEREGVEFTGFVDDPYKIISESGVFVAPLRFGAGTPTKILEAMAIGIPVITTPLGVLGIDGVKNDKEIIVKTLDDVGLWASVIKSLLENKKLAEEIGDNGKKFVFSNYRDESSREMFRDMFKKIIG
ncbi:glycosyltransferase family 4 protein [Patescibacteria group bacterium]|nr:glycosyltransferase family 4 protein [Patescibacteria group bacterium]